MILPILYSLFLRALNLLRLMNLQDIVLKGKPQLERLFSEDGIVSQERTRV